MDDTKFPDAYVIFANESGTAQHNGGAGDVIRKGECKIYTNGQWQDYIKSSTPTVSTAPSTSGKVYYYGDINCDNKVNINDVTFIQFMLVGISGYTPTQLGSILGDVTIDSRTKIRIGDANYIQQRLAGIAAADNRTLTEYIDTTQPTAQTQQTTPTQATQATQQTTPTQSSQVTIYFDQGDASGTPVARCFVSNYDQHTDYTMQKYNGSIYKVSVPNTFKKVEFRYNNNSQWTQQREIHDGETYSR